MSSASPPITSTTSIADLLAYAQAEVHKVQPRAEFMLKELFRGYEWNRIDRGNRIRLGVMFHAFAQGEGATLIVHEKKTPQNQHVYRRL